MTSDGISEALEGARQLLEWYRAMGVEAALGLEPVDWLARGDAGPGQGFRLPSLPFAPADATGGAAPGAAAQVGAAGRTAASTPAAGSGAGARPAPGVRPAAGPALPQRVPPQAGALTPAGPTRAFAAMPPDAATLAARGLAGSCATLDDLAAALARFDGCALKTTAKSTCFYRGNPRARLVIIGEAPGSEEDREGRPFVGRAGQLLDLMLKSIGLGEADVHITNVVYWRPPGNRTPTPQEAEACRPFLERQVALVRPDLVLALGGAAAKQVLGVADGIMRIRGRWHDLAIGGHKVRAMATLHPAYLLRTPAAKRLAWRDLLQVRAALS